ncbi:MAG: hypothetical protein OEN55_16925 [Alphaproteobacteria bacterium]|nr:hypothetical protein [Alphaproteobacteria bacterium]
MRPAGVSNQIYRFSLARHDRVPEAAVEAIDGALGCMLAFSSGINSAMTPRGPKRSGMGRGSPWSVEPAQS